MNAAAVVASLEAVGERCGDPAPLVYARLFARWPEMEVQFIRDTNGAIKGEMLAVVVETVLALAEGGSAAQHMITSELVNHEAWGVPPTVFGTFFPTVMETFREILGPDWTAEMEAGWRDLLAELDVLVARQAEASGLAMT
jgi:hemoglobin-like flavoprotein